MNLKSCTPSFIFFSFRKGKASVICYYLFYNYDYILGKISLSGREK